MSRRLLIEPLELRQLLAFNVLATYEAMIPADLVLARIDHDTQQDLIMLMNDQVSIRLGNGDGTFGDESSFTAGPNARSVIAGDFTDDGVTDLVISHYASLSFLIGNGNGTFQPPQIFSLPPQIEMALTGSGPYTQHPQSIATGDLNEDGTLDLVVGGFTSFPTDVGCYYSCAYIYSVSGYVNVLLGSGDGVLAYVDADPSDTDLDAHPLGAGLTPSSIAVGDLNNDLHPDVISADFYSGLSVLLGNSTGDLESPIRSGSGKPLSSLSLGDVDGDGFADTVLGTGRSLLLQKNQGDGSFMSIPVTSLSHQLSSAVIGDVNDDGKLDLVAVGSSLCAEYGYYGWCYDTDSTRQASVLLGNGDGTFSLPIISSLGAVNYVYSYLIEADLADLTGDGLPDIVALDSYYYGAGIVAINDGNWTVPVELSISDTSVVEENSGTVNAIFTVSLDTDPGSPVTVDFETSDLSAIAGIDYVSQSGTLSFGPGNLSQTITVPVYGDRLGEGDRIFHVNLKDPSGAALRDTQAVGTIIDNEPSISIDHNYFVDPLTVIEGDVGTTPAVFTVTLSRPYDQEVTVDYYTLTGHTDDIIDTSGTLHFAPNQTSQSITVQVVGDLIYEQFEAFNLYLANPSSNASIAAGAGYCYIQDNDPIPLVSISDASRNEGNRGTTAFTFTVSLSSPNVSGAYVEYATSDGTATTADQDYVEQSGVVYFGNGETTRSITITVRGDRASEASETFYVNLIGAEGAAIADGQGVGTIVNDDKGSSTPLPSIRISDASIVEGNGGSQLMTFAVSLSEQSDVGVWVNYTTTNHSAKASDNDYVSKSGTLYFAPGDIAKEITVTINGDTQSEKNEDFYVKLSGAVNGVIADSQGVGTILNDDINTRRKSLSDAKSVGFAFDDLLAGPAKKPGRS